MDLSWLKWVILVVVLAGAAFLLSPQGNDYMIKGFTKAQPGADPARDKADEAGLTRLGGFLMKTFRYQKAFDVFQLAIDRYPTGQQFWYNKYRQVRCAEKAEKYALATTLLEELMRNNAHEKDGRVPENANLKLRADKLIEMYDLRNR